MSHCCVYVYSDRLAYDLSKSNIVLRGRFAVGEKAEAKWKREGEKTFTAYLSKIIQIGGKI